jgi:transcriptional regulator with GAF, ATPase, and Fis domain
MDKFASLNLIGRSPAFLAALETIGKFASCDATVLIQGETGTGKELAARAIHYASSRRDRPFIPINCGALPDSLVESELFGHVRGAFTDAREARVGLVEQARGGTLFLDEIETITPHAQVTLLRFLQDREFRPVGGSRIARADVRILAATNVDLRSLVHKGAYRLDLFFRLNVLSLRLPALRNRPGDATLLAQYLVDRLNQQWGEPGKVLHPDSIALLESYSWPGNVRELENLIQREFILAKERTIRISSVDQNDSEADPQGAASPAPDLTFKAAKANAVARFEKGYLVALLACTSGNLSLASRLSGKDRSDISRLVRKHGLRRQSFLASDNRP